MTPHEQMLVSILDCRRVDLYTRQVRLTPEQESAYLIMQRRFESGEPLQYIIGYTDFFGLRMDVSPGVLIPRPETEILVDAIIHHVNQTLPHQPVKILDLGTGSGNIAVTLAKIISRCRVVTVDVSAVALELAMRNARRHGVEKKISFVNEDMKTYLQTAAEVEGPFDVVVSNPPYIATSELSGLPVDVQCEPRLALDGGADGLQFYRHIAECLCRERWQGTSVFVEVGDGQADAVKNLLSQTHLSGVFKFIKDYVGTRRIVALTPQLVEQFII